MANSLIGAAVLALLLISAVIAIGVYFGRNPLSFGRSAEVPPLAGSARPNHILPASYLPVPGPQPPLTSTGNRWIPLSAKRTPRFAFLSVESAAANYSLKKHVADLDGVIAEQLDLRATPTGFELREWRNAPFRTSWLRTNDPRVSIYPEINNLLTTGDMRALISRKEMRQRLIGTIADYLSQHRYPGVVFDARMWPRMESNGVVPFAAVAFAKELKEKLNSSHRKLLLIVGPDFSKPSLLELSAFADYIVAATYREYGRDSTGAPAGQGWFEQRVRDLAATVPRSKLIIAIGSYCLDTNLAGQSQMLSVQRGWDLAARSKAQLHFDGGALNGSFTYHDRNGLPHRAWLLDAVTAFNELKVALAARPAAVALWSLGLEDPGVWRSFRQGSVPDPAALRALARPQPGYGAYNPVKGVILSALPGHVGSRSIRYNDGLGLVVDEHMNRFPSEAEISAATAVGKKVVALTFDDGPDPRYTGRILDILARKHVKATFYDIGQNMLAAPDLVRREYRAGHDIGSHTFSHVDPTKASPARLAAELNSTAHILRSLTGVKTHLFRPPYAGPGFTYLDNKPQLAVEATKLGYMIGELGVETCDYCSVTPSWIVRSAIYGVVNLHQPVVLLHDGGGDRNATVAALPEIIDKLRAAGYRFVTTHELIGLSRAQVMPLSPSAGIPSDIASGAWVVSVTMLGWILNFIPWLAIVTAAAGILRVGLITLLAVFQFCRFRRGTRHVAAYDGPVAVLVPAYNEQPTICKTVSSILASTQAHRLEVVVIDDGSTDGTVATLVSEFGDDARVRVVRKENGGKASALNAGIAATSAPIVVVIDGDTVLLPDAIQRLTAHFSDNSIGAVAGNVEVGNRISLMTGFQALEYVTSQNLDRRAFELFNAVGVVPGAIGAWRRDALIEAGGYKLDTLAEDAELTFALERRGWRVICEPCARALTEAPESVGAFLKQRVRWTLGTLQAAVKHIGAIRERPKGLSILTIPNVFLFQFGFTLFAPMMDALCIIAVLPFVGTALFGGAAPDNRNLIVIAQYWLVFQAIDLLAAFIGIWLDGQRRYWLLLPLIVLQRVSYRQLLYVAAIKALLSAIKGKLAGWSKVLRTGTVPSIVEMGLALAPSPGPHALRFRTGLPASVTADGNPLDMPLLVNLF